MKFFVKSISPWNWFHEILMGHFIWSNYTSSWVCVYAYLYHIYQLYNLPPLRIHIFQKIFNIHAYKILKKDIKYRVLEWNCSEFFFSFFQKHFVWSYFLELLIITIAFDKFIMSRVERGTSCILLIYQCNSGSHC